MLNGLVKTLERKLPEREKRWQVKEESAAYGSDDPQSIGWHRYTGLDGHIVGMKKFGASAPLKELQQKFGFTPDQVVAAAKAQVERTR